MNNRDVIILFFSTDTVRVIYKKRIISVPDNRLASSHGGLPTSDRVYKLISRQTRNKSHGMGAQQYSPLFLTAKACALLCEIPSKII